MKTEQTLVGALFVVCAALVFTALVMLVTTQMAPVDVAHAAAQALPHAAVAGH